MPLHPFTEAALSTLPLHDGVASQVLALPQEAPPLLLPQHQDKAWPYPSQWYVRCLIQPCAHIHTYQDVPSFLSNLAPAAAVLFSYSQSFQKQQSCVTPVCAATPAEHPCISPCSARWGSNAGGWHSASMILKIVLCRFAISAMMRSKRLRAWHLATTHKLGLLATLHDRCCPGSGRQQRQRHCPGAVTGARVCWGQCHR
jgi:cytochrome c biogenesis factor